MEKNKSRSNNLNFKDKKIRILIMIQKQQRVQHNQIIYYQNNSHRIWEIIKKIKIKTQMEASNFMLRMLIFIKENLMKKIQQRKMFRKNKKSVLT